MKRKKNEEYEDGQMTKIYVFGFKLYFAQKQFEKKLFLPSNFIYSFYELQDIWNTVIIHQGWIYMKIEILI